MPRYVAERDCYGFKGLYYRAGDTIEVSSKDKPPRHFKKIEKAKEEEMEEEQDIPPSK